MENQLPSIYSENGISKLMEVANFFAKSSLLRKELRGKPQDIATILIYGSECNLSPMVALREIYVVDGQPTMSGKCMLGMIRKNHPQAKIVFDENPKEKSVKVTMTRQNGDSFSSEWTEERARPIMVNYKGEVKDTWRKYLQTMLRWRAVTEAARIIFPETIMGFYLEDELEGEVDHEEVTREVAEIVEKKKEFQTDLEEAIDNVKTPTTNPGDWVMNMGKFKGQKLSEVSQEEIQCYYKALKAYPDKKCDANQKIIKHKIILFVEGQEEAIPAEAKVIKED